MLQVDGLEDDWGGEMRVLEPAVHRAQVQIKEIIYTNFIILCKFGQRHIIFPALEYFCVFFLVFGRNFVVFQHFGLQLTNLFVVTCLRASIITSTF